jgi:hypothetical protein
MLFKNISFEMWEYPGCCSANILSRVGGAPCSVREAKESLDRLKKEKTPVMSLPENRKNMLSKWPKAFGYTVAFSMPHEIMYGSILAKMLEYTEEDQTAWVALDSYSDHGDTQQGLMSTRMFMQWLINERLLDSYSESPTEMGRRKFIGWHFMLEQHGCKDMVETLTTRMYNRYNRRLAGCTTTPWVAHQRPQYGQDYGIDFMDEEMLLDEDGYDDGSW